MVANNKEVVNRFIELAFVKNDLENASKLLADEYWLHDPSRPNGITVGIEAWKSSQLMYLGAIPDRRWSIQRQFQDGDCVITQWTIEGTQKGDLPGIRATKRPFKVEGIVISRVKKERITEQWQIWDTQGFLEQINAEAQPRLKAS
ncbi:MAG: ester cyclase [Bdellovibrionia bacterium]